MITLTVPTPYNFARSVRDHGWIALAPFRWIDEQQMVQRVEKLSSGNVVLLEICADNPTNATSVSVNIQPDTIAPQELDEIIERVRWMLRLDEDFTVFYTHCKRDPVMAEKMYGRGRLLRSSTIFEDCVKTIATTNTTWSQTKGMVARLVERLGEPHPLFSEHRAFPTPEQILNAGEDVFQSDIRLGYRNAYVLQLAREVAEGQRDLESLKHSNLPYKELKRELKKIMGVGDYAAHTLLMLLGRYEEVAVDSEMRAHVRRKFPNGATMTDKEMAMLYDEWGQWKFLAYWFDMIDGPVT